MFLQIWTPLMKCYKGKSQKHSWSILLIHMTLPYAKVKSESEVAQSCPTFCNPVDCNLPGSSLHGILQTRVLEWGAIAFSRGSSWPRDRTWDSCIAGRGFNLWATREAYGKWDWNNQNFWINPSLSLCFSVSDIYIRKT